MNPVVPENVPLSIAAEEKKERQYDSDDSLSSLFMGPDDYDSEEDVDEDLLARYYQQINESDGFDITDFPPGRCWYTTIFSMKYYLKDPETADQLKDYAGKALKQYNDRNGTKYEVKEVLNVNGGGCRDFIYYITFSVKNGVHDTFQAKVAEDIKEHLEFPIVRPKVKAVG